MFGSRRPDKSRRGKFWYWLNPALGKSLNAWVIGPLVGVETHYLNETRPCRFYLTGGRMKCFCGPMKLEAVWKGYVPLRDENGVQCFCIIGERFAELAERIPLFTGVEVSRLRQAGSPVCVKPSTWAEGMSWGEVANNKPADLRPILLRLWKDQELIDWLNAHPEEHKRLNLSDPDVSMGQAVVETVKEHARQRAAVKTPGTLDEAMQEVFRKNGKAKH